jgi:hypothetical protein
MAVAYGNGCTFPAPPVSALRQITDGMMVIISRRSAQYICFVGFLQSRGPA